MKYVWVGVLTVFIAVGCHFSFDGDKPKPHVTPGPMFTRDQVVPATPPPIPSKLTLAGLELTTQLKFRQNGSEITIESIHDGTSLEHESYRDEPDKFSIVQAASETFSPPLEILRFPLVPGRSWNWKGQMKLGDSAIWATGVITPSLRSEYINGNQRDVVHVDVQLKMQVEGDKPAPENQMNFDFVFKGGLQSREFGTASKREPDSGAK